MDFIERGKWNKYISPSGKKVVVGGKMVEKKVLSLKDQTLNLETGNHCLVENEVKVIVFPNFKVFKQLVDWELIRETDLPEGKVIPVLREVSEETKEETAEEEILPIEEESIEEDNGIDLEGMAETRSETSIDAIDPEDFFSY